MSLVLIDTSIWIDAFSRRPTAHVDETMLSRAATCSPVVQEVLQGISDEHAFARARIGFLALPILGEPIGIETFLHAGEIFRLGRRRGHTIRSSVDCLIAAIALENKVTVWSRDRDYRGIATFTDLRLFEPG